MAIARMRTVAAAAALIREIDPGTNITPYCLRQWVLDGTVPHVRAGNKRLINVDLVLEMLAANIKPDAPEVRTGTVHPIELNSARGRRT